MCFTKYGKGSCTKGYSEFSQQRYMYKLTCSYFCILNIKKPSKRDVIVPAEIGGYRIQV